MSSLPPVSVAILTAVVMLAGCECDEGEARAPSASSAEPAPALVADEAWRISDRPVTLPEQSDALSMEAARSLLAPDERAALQLLSSGKEPRGRHRYDGSVGHGGEVAIDAEIALHVESDQGSERLPVPSLRAVLRLEITERRPRLAVAIAVGEIAASGGEQAADIAAEMAPVVAKLEGAESRLELTPRGAVVRPPPPEGAGAPVRQLWSTLAEALADAVVPVPAEPIGAGARWRVLDRVRRAGAWFLRLSEVTASPQPDGSLALDLDVREVAVAAGARDPALGGRVRLEVLDGLGVGTRRLALGTDAPWPRVSASEIASDLTLRAEPDVEGGEPQTSIVHLTQVLALMRADAVDATSDEGQGGEDAP